MSETTEEVPQQGVFANFSMGKDLFKSFRNDITGVRTFNKNEKPTKESISSLWCFLEAPIHFEKFMFFGIMICLEKFLYIFTLFPLRVLYSVFFCIVCPFASGHKIGTYSYEIFKVVIVVMSVSFFDQVLGYTTIIDFCASQSTLAAGAIYGTIAMFRGIFTEITKEGMNAVYLTLSGNGSWASFPLQFAFAFFGILLESYVEWVNILFIESSFLSHTKLIAIIMAGQFGEIRSQAKTMESGKLMSVSISDARERFQILFFLAVIYFDLFTKHNFNLENYDQLLKLAFWLLGTEVIVDWLKHGYVALASHKPRIYSDFGIRVVSGIEPEVDEDADPYDPIHMVTRRFHFHPLLYLIIALQAVSHHYAFNLTNVLLGCAVWVGLVALKIFLRVGFLNLALQHYEKKGFEAQKAAEAEKKSE